MPETGNERYQLHANNSERLKKTLGDSLNQYTADDILAGLAPERMDSMLDELNAQLTKAGADEEAKNKIRENWLTNAKSAVESAIAQRKSGERDPRNIEKSTPLSASEIKNNTDTKIQRLQTTIAHERSLAEVELKEKRALQKEIDSLEQNPSLTHSARERLKLLQKKHEEISRNLRNSNREINELEDKLEQMSGQ